MNATEFAHALPAPIAVIAGLLICFCGYRILKLTLAIVGFIAASGAGWTFGSSLAPNNSGVVALVCAVVAGIIGAALCVWLFFLGVFVVGASAGVIVGEAFFNAAGNPPQPILLVVLAVVFGIVALVMQKFMIIASTALSGSYLVVAGGLHLLNRTQDGSLLWFDHLHPRPSGMLGYVALGLWIVLGVVGLSFQYRHSQAREKAARPEPKTPP